MLLNLITTLKGEGYHTTLITLKRVDIPFSDYDVCIVIDDIEKQYKVFIVDKQGSLEDMELCKTVEEVIQFITFYDMSLIFG